MTLALKVIAGNLIGLAGLIGLRIAVALVPETVAELPDTNDLDDLDPAELDDLRDVRTLDDIGWLR